MSIISQKGNECCQDGIQFDNGCICMKSASHYQQCQEGYGDYQENRCRLTLVENQFTIVNINKLYSNKTYLYGQYAVRLRLIYTISVYERIYKINIFYQKIKEYLITGPFKL